MPKEEKKKKRNIYFFFCTKHWIFLLFKLILFLAQVVSYKIIYLKNICCCTRILIFGPFIFVFVLLVYCMEVLSI
ncbi:unnamed protein product [Leptidea sinapis]|uniref:Uncharacterized protein n=1 Tax=Leptidea sinapis TaxID=189913 RepID=A0A5E4QXR7_9NEOP|nr:unnamed protein product [Leptidea sinapis]